MPSSTLPQSSGSSEDDENVLTFGEIDDSVPTNNTHNNDTTSQCKTTTTTTSVATSEQPWDEQQQESAITNSPSMRLVEDGDFIAQSSKPDPTYGTTGSRNKSRRGSNLRTTKSNEDLGISSITASSSSSISRKGSNPDFLSSRRVSEAKTKNLFNASFHGTFALAKATLVRSSTTSAADESSFGTDDGTPSSSSSTSSTDNPDDAPSLSQNNHTTSSSSPKNNHESTPSSSSQLFSPKSQQQQNNTLTTEQKSRYVTRILSQLMTQPVNRSCADCKSTLIDMSQIYVSVSPMYKTKEDTSRRSSNNDCNAVESVIRRNRNYDSNRTFVENHSQFAPPFPVEKETDPTNVNSNNNNKQQQQVQKSRRNKYEPHSSLVVVDPALTVSSAMGGGYAVFVCAMCGAVHKIIGREFAMVHSAQDPNANWTTDAMNVLYQTGGNARAALLLERYLSKDHAERIRPTTNSTIAERLLFVRAKYQALAFVLPQSTGPYSSNAWNRIVQIYYPNIWGTTNGWAKSLVSSTMNDLTLFSSTRTLQQQSNSLMNAAGGELFSSIGTLPTTVASSSRTTSSSNNNFMMDPSVSSSANAVQGVSRQRVSDLPDRLVDHFCVITASPYLESRYIRERHGKRMSIQPKSPEHVHLQPVITDCYPAEETHVGEDFPEHIATFVFPEGCKPSIVQVPPTFFTLVLTDSAGDRLYGAVLKVYDDVRDFDWLRQVFLNHPMEWGPVLPDWLMAETAPSSTTTPPSTHTTMGAFAATSEENGIDYQTTTTTTTTTGNKNQYNPRESTIPSLRTNSGLNHPNTSDVVFVPKCLVLISHHPFFDIWRKFLIQLYRITFSEAPLPIERFIANFVCEVPLPPPGKVQVRFGFTIHDTVPIERPPDNQLPLVNFSYQPLFASMSISNVLIVMSCLLHETRIALLSKHYSLLVPIAEALLSLLFPFHWQGMYLPVMPYDMLDILDAPVPYLVGLHSRYLDDVPIEQRPSGVVFVDVDNDVVHLGYEDENKVHPRQLPCFPERQCTKLRSKLYAHAAVAYIPPSFQQPVGSVTTGNGIKCIQSTGSSSSTSTSSGSGDVFSTKILGSHHHHHYHHSDYFLHNHNHTTTNHTLLFHSQQQYQRRRKDVFPRTERAFHETELMMPVTGFLCEKGHYTERMGTQNTTSNKPSGETNNPLEKFSSASTKLFSLHRRGVGGGVGRSSTTSGKPSLLHPLSESHIVTDQPTTSNNRNTTNNSSNNNNNNNHRNGINLLDLNEPDGFSTIEIRHAFLRFFVAIFQSYRSYIHNDTFQTTEFVLYGVSQHVAPSGIEFVKRIVDTQLFHAFIDERIRYPNDAEVLFFDESIVEKQNRSTTKKAFSNLSSFTSVGRLSASKHNKRSNTATTTPNATPTTNAPSFLYDTSCQITDVFTPPPPSNWGLPDDGRTYSYGSFPKLNVELFGKVREPMKWNHHHHHHPNNESIRSTTTTNSNNTSRQHQQQQQQQQRMMSIRMTRRSMSVKTHVQEQAIVRRTLLVNNPAITSSAHAVVKSVVNAGAKNLESAIQVLSTPFIGLTRTTSKSMDGTVGEQQQQQQQPNNNRTNRRRGSDSSCVSDVTLSSTFDLVQNHHHHPSDAFSTAEEVLLNARRKQAVLLAIMIQLQSIWRMQLVLKQQRSVRRLAQEKYSTQRTDSMISLSSSAARQKAAIQIQSNIRANLAQTFYRNQRYCIIQLQSIWRMQRICFGYRLWINILKRFQAICRGYQLRTVQSVQIHQRLKLYRHHMFHLWKVTHTPLSFRSRFWPLLFVPRLVHIQLAECELRRLWNLMGMSLLHSSATTLVSTAATTTNNNDGGGVLQQETFGLSDVHYHHARKVEEQLQKNRQSLYGGNGNEKTLFGKLKNRKAVVYQQQQPRSGGGESSTAASAAAAAGGGVHGSGGGGSNAADVSLSSTAAAPTTIVAIVPTLADRVMAERLQMYEKLCNGYLSDPILDVWYTTFAISSKSKHRKVKLTETIWCNFEEANESANFVLVLFPELEHSTNIAFGTPTKKGLRRFPTQEPLPVPLDRSMWVDALVQTKLRHNVAVVADVSIRLIPWLYQSRLVQYETKHHQRYRYWTQTFVSKLHAIQSVHQLQTTKQAGYLRMRQALQ